MIEYARRLLLAPTALALGLLLLAATAPATPSPQPFPDGARVVFLGDSITHSGHYHAYIAHFYETRYPDREILFVNAGVSGGKATDALARLEWDVLVHKPTDVLINLGMNDVGTTHYIEAAPEERDRTTRMLVDRYVEQMTAILNRLQQEPNLRITLLIPTPYDDKVEAERVPAVGKNEAILRLARFLRTVGEERGIPVVDLNAPIAAINERGRANDPTFTFVSEDRVHPRKPGHMVMAYTILKAQGLEGPISEVRIDTSTGAVSAQRSAVEELSTTPSEVTFQLQEESLPYVVDGVREGNDRPSAEPALQFVPFHQEFNRQMLTVTGLSPGNWGLTIDGHPISVYTDEELAGGVDINAATQTPQREQAAKLQRLNAQRWQARRDSRSVPWVRARILDPAGVDPTDEAAALKAVEGYVADNQVTGGSLKYIEDWKINRTSERIADYQRRIDDATQAIRGGSDRPKRLYRLTKEEK